MVMPKKGITIYETTAAHRILDAECAAHKKKKGPWCQHLMDVGRAVLGLRQLPRETVVNQFNRPPASMDARRTQAEGESG